MPGSTRRGRPAPRKRRPAGAGGPGRLALLTVVAGVTGAALLVRTAALAPRTAVAAAGLTVDRWVELAVLAAGLLAAAWLALSGALALACVAAALLGRRWRAGEAAVERLAPAAVRRVVRTAVGVGVGAGLTLVPTAALAADVSPTSPAADGAPVVLDLGWQSTTADAGPRAAETTAGAPDPAGAMREDGAETADVLVEEALAQATDAGPVEEVAAAPVARTTADGTRADDTRADEADDATTRVVLRGDTLWDIATRSLGGTPTDAEIVREVTRWHDANRDVVGADPDRILPGQILRAPA
ncbi:LysM peptidoglycan-binding domain-containing protein [Krasilnikoviella flava]|uniref:Nucleoid-associated protein YgaU, contains BON and LysM domains n=1 Tax=Krasilnikoviella flava TaxID=526729 RepID=A0A1T5I9M5_9MICO|nr:hypothetical protein [Krasilnikoviella flava]SKC35632.1 Nucleoid-associated protein YgaU, contains BON and LysM domains [Krasilnikoviella flava]